MMTPRPRGLASAETWDGTSMWSAARARSPAPRAFAWGIAISILTAVLVLAAPTARSSGGMVPAALTVTLVLDRTSYVSGDNATATAIVYRTPGPTNYTYDWTVRDGVFGPVLATLSNGLASYTYAIPTSYQGTLWFWLTVTDDTSQTQTTTAHAEVAAGYVALTLARSEYNPGERVTAYFGLRSNVIASPAWTYRVVDFEGTTVLSGATNNTWFSYTTTNPASRWYTFTVTASGNGRSATGALTISQAGGYVMSITLDRSAYSPGETIRVHVSVAARGTSNLPSQFRFGASLFGAGSASAITTYREADLFLTVPGSLGSGDLLLIVNEFNTGAGGFTVVHVGPSGSFWSTDVGGVPAYAVALSLLVILLLVAVLAMWRRAGGGMLGGPRPPAPPPPEGPVRAAPGSPMTAMCRRCGKPIDITTSKRPIEVMCPSCGETQVVT